MCIYTYIYIYSICQGARRRAARRRGAGQPPGGRAGVDSLKSLMSEIEVDGLRSESVTSEIEVEGLKPAIRSRSRKPKVPEIRKRSPEDSA